MSDTTATLHAWSDMLNEAASLGQALGLSPCQSLEMAFPAIVGNDEIMAALAALLEPAMSQVAPLVVMGAVPSHAAEEFVHNLYHALQIAAALGHMVGLDESTGASLDIPEDLSAVDWASLPDVLGEDEETTSEETVSEDS